MLLKESAKIKLNVAYCLAQNTTKIFLKILGLDLPIGLLN